MWTAGPTFPPTDADLIVSLCISNTFKLELLQRLRKSLHSNRKTWGGGEGRGGGTEETQRCEFLLNIKKYLSIYLKKTQTYKHNIALYFSVSAASIKQFDILWHHRTAFFSFTHTPMQDLRASYCNTQF